MRINRSGSGLNGKDYDSDVESVNCCQLNVHKARIRESRSRYHNHPEKRLFHKRSCTDVICLLVFIGCLTGWIYLGYFAIKSTSPEALLAPTDSKNRRCGFDEGVKDRPYVFYFDLLKCIPPSRSVLYCDTPRVCVSECPKENFYLKAFLETTNMDVVRSKLICQDGFNKGLIYNEALAEKAVRSNNCAEWYLESKPICRRCLYNRFEMYKPQFVENYFNESIRNETNLTDLHVISDVVLSYILCLVTNKSSVHKFGHAVFQDLSVIWPWLLVHICIAAVVSFIYIAIMRWVSGLMVWLSVFASIGLLLYSSYYTFTKFKEISQYENVEPRKRGDLQFGVLDLLWRKETWIAFFIISVAVLVIILVTIVFLRRRISLAVELIKEGSKAVTSSWSAVIFPVFPWIIQIVVVAYSVVIFAYLMNSGIPIRKVVGLNGSTECVCENSYHEGSYCDEKIFKTQCYSTFTKNSCLTAACVYSDTETQKQAIYLHLYNLLMFLWSLFFASGFGQMVLASTFATYYWTFNKDDLPVFMVAAGVGRVIRYHLGTISFGSLLLALCNWIRVLIELLYNYLNKYDNHFVKFLKCCCSCLFWLLNTFLKFLNKNAYIMCAVHGQGFCNSARLAFNLLVRNMLRVAVLDRVTNFLFFLGKVMMTSALGLLAFHFFSNPVPPIEDPFKGETYDVEYYFVPIVIICVVTYFITSLFFGVYSMAVDTLFLCALEDLETNDGSPERPYFMSKNLMKILKKKNEIKVNK